MIHQLGLTLVADFFVMVSVAVVASSQDVDSVIEQEKASQKNAFVLPVLDSFPPILSSQQRQSFMEGELPYSIQTRSYRDVINANEPEFLQVSYPESSHSLFPRSSKPNVVLPGAIIVDPRHGILLPEGRSRSELEPVIWDSFHVMERYLNKRNQTKLPIIKSRKRRSMDSDSSPLLHVLSQRSESQSSSDTSSNRPAAQQPELNVLLSSLVKKNNESQWQVFISNDSVSDMPPQSPLGLQQENSALPGALKSSNSSNETNTSPDIKLKRMKRFWLVPLPNKVHRNRREVLPYHGKAARVGGSDLNVDNKTLMTTFAKASEAVLQLFQADKLHQSPNELASRYPSDLYKSLVEQANMRGASSSVPDHKNAGLDEAFPSVYENLKAAEDEKKIGTLESEGTDDASAHKEGEHDSSISHRREEQGSPHVKHKPSLKKRHRGGGHRRPPAESDDTSGQTAYEDVTEADDSDSSGDAGSDYPDTSGGYRSSRRGYHEPSYALHGDAHQGLDFVKARSLRAPERDTRSQQGVGGPLPSGPEDGQLVSVNGLPYVLIKDTEALRKEDEAIPGEAVVPNPLDKLGMIYRPLKGRKVDLGFLSSLQADALITPNTANLKDGSVQPDYPLAVLFKIPRERLLQSLRNMNDDVQYPTLFEKRSSKKEYNGIVKGKEGKCIRVRNSVVCYNARKTEQ
ncbi:uncharacterized protein LOC135366095 [Ornithodoros turicata]|uniref:uncharacterized protein LOC135366095 n=1 Tax=Ornithodoros turicata TaxID=34597 RepID=UPI00313A3F26